MKQSVIQTVKELENINVQPKNIMPVAQGNSGNDVEYYEGFSKEAALKESERCLRCGILCYEQKHDN